MITEVDAEAKWCPLATASHTDPRAGFNNDGRPKTFPCIGSACMAWQWGRQQYEDGEPLPMGTVPADPEWVKDGTTHCVGGDYGTRGETRQRWRRPLPRKGFCGAFARPA